MGIDDKVIIHITLNHNEVDFEISKDETLAFVLRNQADIDWPVRLVNNPEKCQPCKRGNFLVMLNQSVVNANYIRAKDIDQSEIETIDYLCANSTMGSLVKCFSEGKAYQNGYCVPGIELSLFATLKYNPTPAHEDIRRMLSNNLCDCVGEKRIERAVNNIYEIVAEMQRIQSENRLEKS